MRPVLIGTDTSVIMGYINTAVGILVGLTTILYLVIRIKKELKK